MATSLEQLRASGTIVVADTGDFESKQWPNSFPVVGGVTNNTTLLCAF